MDEPTPPAPTVDTPKPPTKKRRWRLAMRLRTWMILILVIAVWLGVQLHRVREVRHAVHLIELAGGQATFEPLRDRAGRWKSRWHPPQWLYARLGPEYFAPSTTVTLRRFGSPSYAEGSGGSLTPEIMQAICTLPRLKHLKLSDVDVRDENLVAIGGQADLETFQLQDSTITGVPFRLRTEANKLISIRYAIITGDGMKQLARVKRLRSISISLNTHVDTTVIEAWATLPNLRVLDLTQQYLEDDGFQALGKFRGLEELWIGDDFGFPARQLTQPLPITSWGSLRHLTIGSIALSRQELFAISQLPNLETLGLHYTGIDDEKLLLFREMQGLKLLILSSETPRTQGISALKQARPALRIIQ